MKLNVYLTEDNSLFPVTFLDEKDILEIKFESLQILHIDDAEYYDGPTFVIPNFKGHILQTAEKKMRTHVLVSAIPVQSVSNPQGGMTVTIGSI